MLCIKCGREILEGALVCYDCQVKAESATDAKTKSKINTPVDEKGTTLLMLAVMNEQPYVVRSLIGKDADINAKNYSGVSALMAACYYGYKDIAKRLINAGADINACCKAENTPLIYAVTKGYAEIVNLLIDSNVKINYKTSKGFTALMCGAQKGQAHIVKMLIDAGADVNAKNEAAYLHDNNNTENDDEQKHESTLYNVNQYSSGNTALMSAARRGYVEIVEMLIKAGADITAKDHNNNTALMLAEKHRHLGVVRILKDAEEAQNDVKINKIMPIVFVVLFVVFLIIDPFQFRGSQKNAGGDNLESVVEAVDIVEPTSADSDVENIILDIQNTDESANINGSSDSNSDEADK